MRTAKQLVYNYMYSNSSSNQKMITNVLRHTMSEESQKTKKYIYLRPLAMHWSPQGGASLSCAYPAKVNMWKLLSQVLTFITSAFGCCWLFAVVLHDEAETRVCGALSIFLLGCAFSLLLDSLWFMFCRSFEVRPRNIYGRNMKWQRYWWLNTGTWIIFFILSKQKGLLK